MRRGNVVSCEMSCHVMSCHVMSMSCDVMSSDVMRCHVMSSDRCYVMVSGLI